MTVLRDHYFRLGSEVFEERLGAATKLVSDLIKVNDKDEWDYALNRLIKGLTSTRQSARLGYSVALIEVARELVYREDYDLSVSKFLHQIFELSDVKTSMKGKEERAMLFGRLFGLQILLNSQLLFDEKVSSRDTLFQFVDALVGLAVLKSWLRESAFYSLCQFSKLVKDGSDADSVYSYILLRIDAEGLNLSSEGLAIYLTVPKSARKDYVTGENGRPNWINGDPLYKKNLVALAKTLKDSEVVEAHIDEDGPNKKEGSLQKSTWSPRIHFVWDLILEHFVTGQDSREGQPSPKKRKKSSKSSKTAASISSDQLELSEFWKIVVDETFFANKASHERKYWGFEIFSKFLHKLQPTEVTHLFTPNLMRSLINQSSQSDRLLHKKSIAILKTIVEVSVSECSKAPYILECLLDEKRGGCWNFDLVTKSKCVDSMISIFNSDDQIDAVGPLDVNRVIQEIKNILVSKFKALLVAPQDGNEEASEFSTDKAQKWFLDKLLLLFRSHRNILKDSAYDRCWFEDLLKFLLQYSFFKRENKPFASSNVKAVCQERLSSVLSDLIGIQDKDLISWSLSSCSSFIRHFEESEKYINMVEFDESLQKVKIEAFGMLREIQESKQGEISPDKLDQLYSFEILFFIAIIQIYVGDEEIVNVLEEVKQCFRNLFQADQEVTAGSSSITLTEVVLSFVSQKSSLLKRLALIVWETVLCSKDEEGKFKLTNEALELLFDILVARENKEGQKRLFEGEDEYQVEGEDNENKSGEDNKSDSEESSDNSDSSSNESDSDLDDANDIDDVDKQTNIKLAQALGIPTNDSNEVKFEDLSSENESDAEASDSMDDEEMMAIDGQLSRIFKERQVAISSVVSGNQRKNEVIDAREQMVFFKNRVLDLLTAFNKANPSSHLNLSMIKPLIILINLTMDKDLGLKAHKLLKTKISKTRLDSKEIATILSSDQQQALKTHLIHLMSWLHDQANSSKSSNKSHALACSQASIIVAKSLITLDSTYLQKVIEIYSKSMKNWAENSTSNIQPSLFFDFINWLSSRKK